MARAVARCLMTRGYLCKAGVPLPPPYIISALLARGCITLVADHYAPEGWEALRTRRGVTSVVSGSSGPSNPGGWVGET